MSQDDFAIEGNFIRAPLRLLTGVGEKAHEELVAGRPYKDIRDFVQRIYDLKVSTGTRKQKVVKKKILKRNQVEGGPTHTEMTVEELKLGRSNLNKTVLLKLIVSGTADSLFPPEVKSVSAKLAMFSEVWAEVHNLRNKDGSLKIEPVDSRFDSIGPLQQFMLKKAILPSYSANLGPLVSAVRDDVTGDGGRTMAWASPRSCEGNKHIPIVPGDVAAAILEGQTPGDFDFPDAFKFAVIAYINDVQSFWNNKAYRVSFEVDGERMESVIWPKRSEDSYGNKTQEAVSLPEGFKGSVSILSLVRWRAGKPFSLDDVVVVSEAFSMKSGEQSE